MRHSSFTLQRPAASRALTAVLCLTLLLAQLLGLAHGIQHGRSFVSAPLTTHVAVTGTTCVTPSQVCGAAETLAAPPIATLDPVPRSQRNSSWLGGAFSVHGDGSAECRLFDALGHDGAGPTLATLDLPASMSVRYAACSEGDALARRTALYDARAPPRTS